jgi:hypothetical protein
MRAKIRLRKTNFSPTSRRLYTVLLSCLTTLQLFLLPLAIMTVAPARVSAETPSDSPMAIIYDNGPLATGATSRSGVAAPAGTQWSEAQSDYGSTTISNTNAGVSCSVTATVFRCADDFNVPVGQTWTINQVIIFAYQTGFAGATSPITAATLRIWIGRPGDAGSTIVFGDTTTNRLASSVDSGLWRIFNSTTPPPGTATATNRRVWQTAINVAPAAVLTAGNYWIDWNTAIGTAAHFAPAATIVGTRGVPGWNIRQSVNGGTSWVDSFDDGNPLASANIIQEFPFKLDGSIAGAPATPASRRVDFDGDNKADAVVARSASAATQTTWHILSSAGGNSAVDWGLGVGFTGGDIATPEDFDGDGKTDIAVWRSHATEANFYILQSSNGALRTEQFGREFDDPTVVDDYDGDGKADVAVFRTIVGPGDPCGSKLVWYYRPSSSPSTNFISACWGMAGDKPFPGDFDGDGKADFSVVRNNGGVGDVYQNRTTAGQRVISFGNFTDKYISGDVDADGRADLMVARTNGGSLDWYFLCSGNQQLFFFTLGNATSDFVVPGDYDGDNKTDFALWRSGPGADGGSFYLLKTFSSPSTFKFGSSAVNLTAPDYPVGAYQVH